MSESFLKEFEENTGEKFETVLSYICAVANSLFHSKEYERKVFVEILNKKTDTELIEALIEKYNIKETQGTSFCVFSEEAGLPEQCFDSIKSPIIKIGLGFKENKTKSFYFFCIQNTKEITKPYNLLVYPNDKEVVKFCYENIYDYELNCYKKDIKRNCFFISNDKDLDKTIKVCPQNLPKMCITLKGIQNYNKTKTEKINLKQHFE